MAFEPTKITRAHVIRAMKNLYDGESKERPSTGYDLYYNGEIYPPKNIIRLAHEYATGEYLWQPGGGEPTNKYLKALGFIVLPKEEIPYIDGSKLSPLIGKYNRAINETDWLKSKEIYKFNFIKWFEANVNLDNTDAEIKAKIIESQKILFDPTTKVKGINFLQTIVRYQDEYITTDDLQLIRKIISSDVYLTDQTKFNLSSYPKVSLFLSLFAPEMFTPYDSESSPAFEHLNLNITIPKKGFRAFQFNQMFYQFVKSNLKKSHVDQKPFKQIFEVGTLNEQHWNWITQDFLLYTAKEIMHAKTLQQYFDEFAENEGVESWDWYRDLREYSEAMKQIKSFASIKKYPTYDALNKDYKFIIKKDDDFLNRYLFESYNGFSRIQQQLITVNRRSEINAKVRQNPQLLFDLLTSSDKQVVFTKAHELIGENKWSVLYRFTRALFPEDFTAVDAPKHFERLEYVLKNDFDIYLNETNQISKNKEIVQLVESSNTYLKQIFFWMLLGMKINESETNPDDMSIDKKPTLNQILFGPPGTGKTYHSIDKALQIIDEEEEKKLSWTNREEVKKQFDKRLTEGRIVFTTFHQSMSYEDFIEGIKPVLDSEETDDATEKESLKYEIKDGIFKSIANLATGVSGNIERTTEIDFGSKDFYKMSLGGKHRPEKHNWSIKNNLIFLGWGDDKDFTALKGIKDWKPFRDKFKQDYPELVAESKYVIQAVFIFQNMKVGDIVFITKGNNIIDAIGVITGEYFYDDSQEIDNYQFRNVKWLATDLNAAPDVFIRKKISQQTIYEFYNNDVKIEVLEDYFNSSDPGDAQEKKYVLIIDEINRGNVSQIFGELITLIEQDKRIGQDEALEITLPYSKQKFGVPDNLYIIGTMNTADRSVEALDTALRRRFSFEEMPPKYKLPELEYEVYGYQASEILKTINHRIEKLLDRDHAIGHSYFINKDEETIVESFYKCIIPLLQEYFFGDYGKIGLVLGKGFISKKEWDKSSYSFADFDYEGSGDFDEKEVYRIIDYRSDESSILSIDQQDVAMDFGKAIRLLMKGSVIG
ncbi:AAA family ATPase [Flavobacterium sp.]|uniref:AAA family ATPase n=1 Tax=Flavobacterium sp. TaxID=239 RepID=UPI0040347FDE